MLELMGEIDERNGGRVDKFLREREAMEADEEAPEADTEE